MKVTPVTFFTAQEEKIIRSLVAMGYKLTVAKTLVYLASHPDAATHEIEKGADMSQPEVSLALSFLMDRSWVTGKNRRQCRKGRPRKIYRLAADLTEIVAAIEKEKTAETRARMQLVQRLRHYAGACDNRTGQAG